MADDELDLGLDPKVRGGIARAKALPASRRQEIAREAAHARWSGEIPRATHTGELRIGNLVIPCAVLEDGTRVLTQWGFLRAIGRSGRPAAGRGSDVEKMAPFLALDNLKPYVSQELADSTKPVVFRVPKGGKAFGYRADLLPRVCEVYLKARDDDALISSQLKFARACDLIMRGLAHVGIVALVDEATGYQEVRDRLALQAILDAFLAKELAAWAKRFPSEFYQQIFRLRGWDWEPANMKTPRVVAKYTNDLVYLRLVPDLLKELERLNPKDERGNRRAKHHQWLTEDVGHPALAQHLHAVIALMRASESWDDFKRLLDRALPRRTRVLDLPLFNSPISTSGT
ncbi:MAG TPA: P63C domain-containing protein [Candidatus Binatia bacterium]|jgi:hypothetical protein